MWQKLLGGGIDQTVKTVAGSVVNIKNAFSTNKEAESQRQHEIDLTALDNVNQAMRQYQAEFNHNRTWFDSLINGINRLMRPSFVTTFLYLCILLPIYDPQLATIAYTSLELVPEYLWYAFLTIMAFLFGGRPLEKFAQQKDSAKKRQETIEQLRELNLIREKKLANEEVRREREEEDKRQTGTEGVSTTDQKKTPKKKAKARVRKIQAVSGNAKKKELYRENKAIKDLVETIKR